VGLEKKLYNDNKKQLEIGDDGAARGHAR